MFCLLVHGIFMHLIVTYVIYFKQYFLLMVPHSTFFWNSNICVLFLQLMTIILNRAHPPTKDRLVGCFFQGGWIWWCRRQSYQVLLIEMPPPTLFEGQFRVWNLSSGCCRQGCSRYTQTQKRRTVGNVHLLFIYKLAMPHHVKLTPLMGSYLSCLKDGLSPGKPPTGFQAALLCLVWAANFRESTCWSGACSKLVSKGLSH